MLQPTLTLVCGNLSLLARYDGGEVNGLDGEEIVLKVPDSMTATWRTWGWMG